MQDTKKEKENSKEPVTCVRLSKETRDRLASIGGKDQTFEDIITGLIDNQPDVEVESDGE